jgi:GNAT superfamily N-acetyltransferase
MEQRILTRADLGELTALINQYIAHFPPWWTLTEDDVAGAITSTTLWSEHYGDELEFPQRETIGFFEQSRLIAAYQWYRLPLSPNIPAEYQKQYYIPWLVVDFARTELLTVLLDFIHGQASRYGCDGIDLRHRSPLGIGWCGIPVLNETTDSVISQFANRGYTICEHWNIFVGQTSISRQNQNVQPSVTLEFTENSAQNEAILKAYDGTHLVGECYLWGIPAHLHHKPSHQEWITLEFIGVEDEYQQQGIGSLLLQEVFSIARLRGISNIVLWTEEINSIMQHLARNYGMEKRAQSITFVRTGL